MYHANLAKFEDPNSRERIRREHDGEQCWRLGQSREHKLTPKWEAIKVDVMYQANLAKFAQNEDLRRGLLATQGPIKAFGFPFWVKWNPVILERIREELRDAADRNEPRLQALVQQMEEYSKSQVV
uniref:NADAR domain-containing protein n=1 Tax=Eutreptiella gymnastica TaxID=73025 RepID=A0A7S1NRY6_9EUGL|mmetsp:Transcript_78425/g.138588  ORF Transcript_78425/g.138588 Transcript_78425/m.138588 type:complete len:126 (+) Transcript_78425:3-380(+)